ncbi:hypothetical protein CYY_006917 [Polysphondylium violaceum]|uniref:Uncharacterized protein n=1 Tax=Polysphondylium violaceum TaxID=133409 RepID=A0A8J4PYP3_9MYCE|nr:hypothetical protein CYY_006917 [Polysphondylium violaceum]
MEHSFFRVFRFKVIQKLIFYQLRNNIDLSYSFYRLPLHVIIQQKKWSYLELKISKYLYYWKNGNYDSNWYLELTTNDVAPLLECSSRIGFQDFILLYNDFKHIFHEKFKTSRSIFKCSDLQVFTFLIEEHKSQFHFLWEDVTFPFFCTSVNVFRYCVSRVSDSLNTKKTPDQKKISTFFSIVDHICLQTNETIKNIFFDSLLEVWNNAKLPLANIGALDHLLCNGTLKMVQSFSKLKNEVRSVASYRVSSGSVFKLYSRFTFLYFNTNFFASAKTLDIYKNLCYNQLFYKMYINNLHHFEDMESLTLCFGLYGDEFLIRPENNNLTLYNTIEHFITNNNLGGLKLLYEKYPTIFKNMNHSFKLIEPNIALLKFIHDELRFKVSSREQPKTLVLDYFNQKANKQFLKYIYQQFPEVSLKLIVKECLKIGYSQLLELIIVEKGYSITQPEIEPVFGISSTQIKNPITYPTSELLYFLLNTPLLSNICLDVITLSIQKEINLIQIKKSILYFNLQDKLLKKDAKLDTLFKENNILDSLKSRHINTMYYQLSTMEFNKNYIGLLNQLIVQKNVNQIPLILNFLFKSCPVFKDNANRNELLFYLVYSSIGKGLCEQVVTAMKLNYKEITITHSNLFLSANFDKISPKISSLSTEVQDYLNKIGFL